MLYDIIEKDKGSAVKMKKNNLKIIACVSIMAALAVVLKSFGIMIGDSMRISFFAVPLMIAGLMIFASCKKDKNPQYPFDHLQWITEEMDGCDLSNYGIDDCARLPEGRLLMDVGATKEDKGYLAWVVTSSDEHYSSGDIVLIDEDSYGYNPETGSFSFPGFDDAMVSFISETKVKVDYDGTATVFDLSTKNYKVKNAIDPLPAGPTAFTLTPEKTSEWAGGSVQINANREVVTWSVDTLDCKTRNADAVYKSVMSSAYDGAIILCHDLHPTTVDAMEKVIPDLIKRGYQLVTVSELLAYRKGEIVAGQVYYRG